MGKTIAHYTVGKKLGAGGMGEVYQATDAKLNREVALKILPEEFAKDHDRMARFKREAQVLASLNHPNIAAIYGLEEQDGTRALVLELARGTSARFAFEPTNHSAPVWAPDGKTLYFRDRQGLMMVSVNTEGEVFRADRPQRLAEFLLPSNHSQFAYDIEPGGKHFVTRHLSNQPEEEAEPTTHLGFIFNWFEEVRSRLDSDKN